MKSCQWLLDKSKACHIGEIMSNLPTDAFPSVASADTLKCGSSNEKQEFERGDFAELYQAAKDENELLEFKNYELLFKIQELELNQRKILSELSTSAASSIKGSDETDASSKQSTSGQPLIKFENNDDDGTKQHRREWRREPMQHDFGQAAAKASVKVSFISHASNENEAGLQNWRTIYPPPPLHLYAFG